MTAPANPWTPGPWQTGLVTDGDGLVLEDEGVVFFSDDGEASIRGAGAIHNAVLISAAPDLYEALANTSSLLELLAGNMDEAANVALSQARAALSKARGEDREDEFPRTLIQTSDVVVP